jgi:hypothetical protein
MSLAPFNHFRPEPFVFSVAVEKSERRLGLTSVELAVLDEVLIRAEDIQIGIK